MWGSAVESGALDEWLGEMTRRHRIPVLQSALYEAGELTVARAGHEGSDTAGEPADTAPLLLTSVTELCTAMAVLQLVTELFTATAVLQLVTELFTATVFLQLVTDGDLALDEPVAGRLPGRPAAAAGVAPRHLLSCIRRAVSLSPSRPTPPPVPPPGTTWSPCRAPRAGRSAYPPRTRRMRRTRPPRRCRTVRADGSTGRPCTGFPVPVPGPPCRRTTAAPLTSRPATAAVAPPPGPPRTWPTTHPAHHAPGPPRTRTGRTRPTTHPVRAHLGRFLLDPATGRADRVQFGGRMVQHAA